MVVELKLLQKRSFPSYLTLACLGVGHKYSHYLLHTRSGTEVFSFLARIGQNVPTNDRENNSCCFPPFRSPTILIFIKEFKSPFINTYQNYFPEYRPTHFIDPNET